MEKEKKHSNKKWCDFLMLRVGDKKTIGAEIGVWEGEGSKDLLTKYKNTYLYLVDWWQATPEGHSYFKGSKKISRLNQEQMDNAYKKALNNLKGFENRITIYKQESAEASKNVKDDSLDWIFFDGDHSEEGLTRDLINWVPKVKKGGWIGGHDWENKNTYGDVKTAVEKFFKDRISEIELDRNTTWFIKK